MKKMPQFVKFAKQNQINGDCMKKEITKDWTIGEVLAEDDDLADILLGFGMHCFSCPISQMETLEEAAAVHDVDLDFLLKKLNEFNQ